MQVRCVHSILHMKLFHGMFLATHVIRQKESRSNRFYSKVYKGQTENSGKADEKFFAPFNI